MFCFKNLFQPSRETQHQRFPLLPILTTDTCPDKITSSLFGAMSASTFAPRTRLLAGLNTFAVASLLRGLASDSLPPRLASCYTIPHRAILGVYHYLLVSLEGFRTALTTRPFCSTATSFSQPQPRELFQQTSLPGVGERVLKPNLLTGIRELPN